MQSEYLTVNLPNAVLKHNQYYTLERTARSVELDFSEELDSSTVSGNISLCDYTGCFDTGFYTVAFGKRMLIVFDQAFTLKPGWKYAVNLKMGLKSKAGHTLKSATSIDLRIPAGSFASVEDSTGRCAVVCISDVHLGEQRSVTNGYGWFSKNAAALESLLDLAMASPQVKQLVILGDLFDEWIVPYRFPPFDNAAGIYTSADYFHAVAASPVNAGVISRFRAMAAGGEIDLVYIPGNHDMLLTKEVLQDIIPGIIWQGDTTGLGHYSPVGEMVMEHGHRYDFFNCPQPLANPGHMLPPGYFVSRLNAQGSMEQGGPVLKDARSASGNLEFIAAWTVSIEYLKFHFGLTLAQDSANILMTGIDQYPGPFSFNGVKNMYGATIEDVWNVTQARNSLPLHMPVVMALVNGYDDLSFTASYEYMQTAAPKKYKVVAFGHTHMPMIKVYPNGNQYTGIYANTGSWVNADLTTKQVRTFLVIKPGVWTGSALDVVSLYQYNLDSGGGNPSPGFVPVMLAEESIER